jgi:tetratricopeptide (TPR) repeat protein/cold shock CspA family protein
MRDVDAILSEVRSLALRGEHHLIVARYGAVDDTPEEETWNSTELLYEIGRAFGMLGNEDKVERYLLRCAELAPRRAAVFHCAIGWYFQRKKKWTKALRWYDRALQSFPTYHLCLFRRGYCLEKLHRPREAVEALARARSVWEQAGAEQRQRGRGVQVQVLFHLSRVLRDLGEFDQAEEALNTCRDLDAETDPPAIRPEHLLACQGELELRRGDLPGALALFREARDLDPTSSYVWERIGRVLELQNDVPGAEAAYRHAVELPRGAFAHLALGRLYAQTVRDLPQAARALAEALRQLPSAEPLVRLELARLHLACGRPRAAALQVEQALACRREGGFAEGLRLAAELAEQLGRLLEAASYLRQLARLVADDDALIKKAAALELRAAEPQPSVPDDAPLPEELAILADAALETTGRARVSGVVDRFFADKGFGFVRYGEGQTLFFHVTQCQDGGSGIEPGAAVSFIVGHNPKKGKPQAEAVRRHDLVEDEQPVP